MRHSPLIDPQFSEGETSAQSPLNSKLQRALNCLDVQLEEELTRYRRQRAGRSITLSNGLKRKQPAKLELMSLGESAPASPPQVPLSLSAHSDTPFEPVEPSFDPVESSRLAIVPPETQTDSEILYPPQVESTHLAGSTPPDDYLESSEELLRSLAREEAQVRVDRGFLESLATPLGVGSMLMLLLSSAMFGYVIMNPSSLSFVSGLLGRSSTPTAATPIAPTNSDGSQAAISNSPPLDKQEFVDLGLGNLTTLKSRGSAPVSKAPKATASPAVSPQAALSKSVQPSVAPQPPASNPAAAPVPSAPTRSYSPSTASRNDAPARSYAPAPVRSYSPPPVRSYSPPPRPYVPPVVQTAPLPPVSVPRSYSPPVSAPTPTQNGGYSYKVEIPYTGDRSLEEARKASPDAYLRPDGKIQLGATGSEADAKARAQELQNQGIPAEVNQR